MPGNTRGSVTGHLKRGSCEVIRKLGGRCWVRPSAVRRPRRSGAELPEQFEARLLANTVNGRDGRC